MSGLSRVRNSAQGAFAHSRFDHPATGTLSLSFIHRFCQRRLALTRMGPDAAARTSRYSFATNCIEGGASPDVVQTSSFSDRDCFSRLLRIHHASATLEGMLIRAPRHQQNNREKSGMPFDIPLRSFDINQPGSDAGFLFRSLAFERRTTTLPTRAALSRRTTEAALPARPTWTSRSAHSTTLTSALHHHGAHLLGTGFHLLLGHLAVAVLIHPLEAAFDFDFLRLAEFGQVDATIRILVHLGKEFIGVHAHDHAALTATRASWASWTAGSSRSAWTTWGTSLWTFTTGASGGRTSLWCAAFATRRTAESSLAAFAARTAAESAFTSRAVAHAFAQALAELADLRHIGGTVAICINLGESLLRFLR